MIKWFKLWKRTGNVVINGQDLGCKPKIEVVIEERKPTIYKRVKPKLTSPE